MRFFERPAQRLRLALGFGQPAQILQRQGNVKGRRDDLPRLALDDSEGGPQDFVAFDDRRERALERRYIQRPTQAKSEMLVVDGVARFELIQKPESLLSKGERERIRRAVTWRAGDGGL